MECYGNTFSSTIPMAIEVARNQGKIQPGDCVMIVGFGVGYSWAATLAVTVMGRYESLQDGFLVQLPSC